MNKNQAVYTGDTYFDAVQWTAIETSGAQQLLVPINKAAVAAGGNTIFEMRVTGVGNFPIGTILPANDFYIYTTHYVAETRIATICDDKDNYRFGFNGMEKDNEPKGIGNSLDFGARIYDSRLGRWLSLDPLAAKYPDLSPYNFVANNPIRFIDPDGKRITDPQGRTAAYIKNGEILFTKYASKDTRTIIQLMTNTEVGTKVVEDMIQAKHNIDLHINRENIQYYNPHTGKKESEPSTDNKLMLGSAERYLTKDRKLTRYRITICEKSIEYARENKLTFKRDGYNVVANEKTKEEMIGAQGVHEGTHAADENSQGFRKNIDLQKVEDMPNRNEAEHYKQLDQ